MRFCPYCGNQVHEQAVICVGCGASLTASPAVVSDKKYCPMCGNECHKDAVICVKCGHGFQPAAPAAAAKKTALSGNALHIIGAVVFGVLALSSLVSMIITLVRHNYGYLGARYPSLGYLLLSSIVDVVGYALLAFGCVFLRKKNSIVSAAGCFALAGIRIYSFIVYTIEYGWSLWDILTILFILVYIAAGIFMLLKRYSKIGIVPPALLGADALLGLILDIVYNFGSQLFSLNGLWYFFKNYFISFLISLILAAGMLIIWLICKKVDLKPDENVKKNGLGVG